MNVITDVGHVAGVLALLCWASFPLLLGIAAIYDVREFRIPNFLPLLLLITFALYAALAPGQTNFLDGLLGGGVTLALGFGLYCMRAMGGGDVKLLAAAALWTGFKAMPIHLFYVTLIGALLAILVVLVRHAVRSLVLAVPSSGLDERLPRVLRCGEPLPYGVAIAVGSALAILA